MTAKEMFDEACKALIQSGRSVQSSDMPGLTYVDGRELTVNQVIDLARRVPPQATKWE